MNFMWRFILIYIISKFQKRCDLFDSIRYKFTTLPTDIDFFMHMNNGRYFSFLDLARLNLLIRANCNSQLNKHHIIGVVASEFIRFKRSIPLFKRFTIVTKMVYWDDKYFYLHQRFFLKKKLCAYSLVRIRCLQKGKLLAPNEVLALINIKKASPPLPAWLNQMDHLEDHLKKEI